MEFKGLKNRNISLRPVETGDLPLLYKWENDTESWKYGDTVSPFSNITLEAFIECSKFDITINKQLRLMIDELSSGKTIGSVDLYDVNFVHGRAGVGILIDKDYRRQGYALQTLDLISGYAFGLLNLHQLYCYIREDNTESLNLFQKSGYNVAGKLLNWVKESGSEINTFILQKLIIS